MSEVAFHRASMHPCRFQSKFIIVAFAVQWQEIVMMMVLGKYLSSDVLGLVAKSRLRDSLDELCTKHIATRNGMAHLA